MIDNELLEVLQLIMDNMATKEDVKVLQSQIKDMQSQIKDVQSQVKDLESGMAALESSLREEIRATEFRLNSSIISKTVTDDDIERIANRAAVMAGALIENTLCKRVDFLSDGYKLNYEKQYDLERRVEVLERAIDDLRTRIA